ncbi:TIGR01777 family oxidoreductase [Myroides guanonis]|uniref:TIGR01777 family protein n=1 Tax=Myroides guanonis TaxID=1150112 RepID=A0A1I3P804_9FLAO|nr:TIGR01777 family oxidoreductase [Myroides guanonis]SFJ17643.1 hypothetical protein SAMN04487893_10419 [Myroides guanonis]
MKILITGATGFLGQSITSFLLGKGHTIHYLTTQPKKLLDSTRYHGFLWNPKKGELNVKSLEGVEVIVHLAGESIAGSWSKEGKERILKSRIVSSQLLFNVLKNNSHKVKNIVCASAIGVYKNSDQWQYENRSEVASDFLGDVVLQWENENRKFESLGIDVCLIRIGLVLSRTAGALPELIKPIIWRFGSVLGSGNQYYSWIHVEDVTRLFTYAIEHNLVGVYNAVAQEPEKNKEFVKKLATKLDRIIWLPRVPTFMLMLVLGEKHVLVTSGQRVSNDKVLETGFVFKFPTLDKALSNLLNK